MKKEFTSIGNDGRFKEGHLWWVQASRMTNDTVINEPAEVLVMCRTDATSTTFLRAGKGDFVLPWAIASVVDQDNKTMVLYQHDCAPMHTQMWWYTLRPLSENT